MAEWGCDESNQDFVRYWPQGQYPLNSLCDRGGNWETNLMRDSNTRTMAT